MSSTLVPLCSFSCRIGQLPSMTHNKSPLQLSLLIDQQNYPCVCVWVCAVSYLMEFLALLLVFLRPIILVYTKPALMRKKNLV